MWGAKPHLKWGAGAKALNLGCFCVYIAANERVRLG